MARLIDKYRPTIFSNLVGQSRARDILKAILDKKLFKTHKEYIFYSPVGGVGKTSLALSFAQSINCETHNSCGHCKSCKLFLEGKDPNFISVNGADFSTTDKIKYLSTIASTAPTKGKMRVIILDEAQRVSKTAQSEFLELLEFNSNRTIFIFTTTNLDSLLAPLRTRCLELEFGKLSPIEIRESLLTIAKQESIDIDDKSLDSIARSADGSMREAIKLLDAWSIAPVEFVHSSLLFEICEALLDDNETLAESLVYKFDFSTVQSTILSDLNAFYTGNVHLLSSDTKRLERWSVMVGGYVEKLIKNFLQYKPDNAEAVLLTIKLSLSIKQKPIRVATTSTVGSVSSILESLGYSSASDNKK